MAIPTPPTPTQSTTTTIPSATTVPTSITTGAPANTPAPTAPALFSWTDHIHVVLATCTPTCLPCLRRVSSDDSLFQQNGAIPPRMPSNTAGGTPATAPPGRHSGSVPQQNSGRRFDPTFNDIPRARPDELQGLLLASSSTSSFGSDVDLYTREDADAVSLHSNFGRGASGRRKQGKKTKVTLWGFDLFGMVGGRRGKKVGGGGKDAKPGGVRLEGGDEALYRVEGGQEEEEEGSALAPPGLDGQSGDDGDARYRDGDDVPVGSTTPPLSPPPHLRTTATKKRLAPLDPDASPLSPTAIALLAGSVEAEALMQAEEERRREEEERKAERRKLRRERKARKALEQERVGSMGLGLGEGEEAFEGFQGSGGGGAAFVPALDGADRFIGRTRTTTTGSSSRSSRMSEEFGVFVRAVPEGAKMNGAEAADLVPSAVGGEEEEDPEAVDLDGGGLYSGKRRAYHPGRSNGGSDSRSRTSVSYSRVSSSPQVGRDGVFSQQQHETAAGGTASGTRQGGHGKQTSILSNEGVGARVQDPLSEANASKKSSTPSTVKSRSKKSSAGSRTHSSSTGSISQSVSGPFSPNLADSSVFSGGEASVVSPSTVEHGLGFFDADDGAPPPLYEGGTTGSGVGKAGRERAASVLSLVGGGISGGGGGFPSTGFGKKSSGRAAGGARDAVAFLAKRGGEEQGGVD